MVKRFRDTGIWDEDWFIELPDKYKLFWEFICDRCDCAGIWKPNVLAANRTYGLQIDLKKALQVFNNGSERVRVLQNGRWFLVGFIKFQYGTTLSESCPAHRGIIKSLLLNEIEPNCIVTLAKPLGKGKPTLKDKDKDICIEEGEYEGKQFDAFWGAYPRKVGKAPALKAWNRATKEKGFPDLERILNSLSDHKGSDQWQKDGGRFIPHPATWLNQRRWEDEVEEERSWDQEISAQINDKLKKAQ